jgi:hypothetical protein
MALVKRPADRCLLYTTARHSIPHAHGYLHEIVSNGTMDAGTIDRSVIFRMLQGVPGLGNLAFPTTHLGLVHSYPSA